ncbi:MAG: hypothetical protein OXT67_01525 [Zetaproteobacteria bacterium]|nr:hypothetical protein [Zetaproteobacteria bacterium]
MRWLSLVAMLFATQGEAQHPSHFSVQDSIEQLQQLRPAALDLTPLAYDLPHALHVLENLQLKEYLQPEHHQMISNATTTVVIEARENPVE